MVNQTSNDSRILFYEKQSLPKTVQYFNYISYLIFILLLGMFIYQVSTGKLLGGSPIGNVQLGLLLFVVLMLIILVNSLNSFITKISDKTLFVGFKLINLFALKYSLNDIRKVEEVKINPVGDFGGWGIRHSKKMGWAFVGENSTGLLVTLNNEKKFFLPSGRSDELLNIIRSAIT